MRTAAANGPRVRRHRVEHAQVVCPADRRRFADLGVIASIQPSHCIDDMRWVDHRLGARTANAYPFASLLAAGARVALGTDWTVEPLDPMLTLYASVCRQFPHGGPEAGWHPAEQVGIEQALAAYTAGSAFAEFQEDQKGRLQPGLLADAVVLSHDVLAIAPRETLDTRVDVTIMGGRVVFERG